MIKNTQIAYLFEELADIMELAGESYFKIRAYRNAAATIGNLSQHLKDISPTELRQLPGIGEAISEKIKAALDTGTFPALEKWRVTRWATFLPLKQIRGLNIRKIRSLIRENELHDISELKKDIDNGKFLFYKQLDSGIRQNIIGFFDAKNG